MDEEQLFLFEDDPVPEEISQDPEPCPFCGGKPHINSKILGIYTVFEQMPWPKNALIGNSWPIRRELMLWVHHIRIRET